MDWQAILNAIGWRDAPLWLQMIFLCFGGLITFGTLWVTGKGFKLGWDGLNKAGGAFAEWYTRPSTAEVLAKLQEKLSFQASRIEAVDANDKRTRTMIDTIQEDLDELREQTGEPRKSLPGKIDPALAGSE